jgi:hypothetical protein
METLVTAGCQALVGWPGDSDVTGPAVALLGALTKGRVKLKVAMGCDSIRHLADQFRGSDSPLARLPAALQTAIGRALCKICSVTPMEGRGGLYAHIIQPMHAQFKATLSNPQMNASTAQEPAVVAIVTRFIFVLRGVAQATDERTAALFFPTIAELFPSFSGLLQLYKAGDVTGCPQLSLSCGGATLCLVSRYRHRLPTLAAVGAAASRVCTAPLQPAVQQHHPQCAACFGEQPARLCRGSD